MNFTTGELMMYGGMAAFAVLLIVFVILMFAFKAQRRKMINRIEKEIGEDKDA